MRDLDPGSLQRQREIDHVADAFDVGAVDDEIDGERQAEPHRFGRERIFALERAAIAGDMIGRHRVGVLDRDLDMIEARPPTGRAACAW